jgi:glycosyltransferase involved in cell wall biosynthesis
MFFGLDPDPGSIQQSCCLMRQAKRMRRDFDCVVATDNEADVGDPAIQYIHAPNLAHVYPKVLPSLEAPLARKLAAFREGRFRPWMVVAGFSYARMKQNRTLVNSDWTGRWMRRVYGIDSKTLYPPAPGDFPDVAWESRDDAFVAVGRLDPNKRLDWCIRVLASVRRLFPEIKLHIIGGTSRFRDEATYSKLLRRLIEANASWVTLHEDVSRVELQRLLAHAKYGIHAMVDEHFGIAVAEMVRAGCIPFVHDSGGAPEIVGYDSRLLYDSEDDAVARIAAVLADPGGQAAIARSLSPRRRLFRPEVFMDGIRSEAARMIGQSPSSPQRGLLP